MERTISRNQEPLCTCSESTAFQLTTIGIQENFSLSLALGIIVACGLREKKPRRQLVRLTENALTELGGGPLELGDGRQSRAETNF